ncbi:MAG: hypothetical protein MSS42_00410 [Bacteroidales bacterium]|nr:hypothetical protein [Bacteroidales bacterium]
MKKIATTILETLGYSLEAFAFCEIFGSHITGDILTSFVTGVIMFVVGFALIEWEFRIESRRTEQVKHYDYIVLIVFGILSILTPLLIAIESGKPAHNAVILFIFGPCLIVFGACRRSIYREEKAKPMADKYKTLVDIILHAHPDSRVYEDTKKVITIGESSCGETYLYNYYIIKEHGNYVKIEMKANHPMWGASELSWKFPKEMDQLEMDRIIKKDIQAMMERKMQSMCDNYNF